MRARCAVGEIYSAVKKKWNIKLASLPKKAMTVTENSKLSRLHGLKKPGTRPSPVDFHKKHIELIHCYLWWCMKASMAYIVS